MIDQTAEDFARVNNSNPITPYFTYKLSDGPLLWAFGKFYTDLKGIVRENLPYVNPTATSQTETPPLKTTVPPDPQYSGSSYSSGVSRESKAEPYTNDAVKDFVWATLTSIEEQLVRFAWFRDNYILQAMSPTLLIFADYSPSQHMKIRLGMGRKRTTAHSDGGISIYRNLGASCHFPVLCLEAPPPLFSCRR